MTEPRDRTIGCLLGGALGDALGAPVEFMKLWMIRERFGPMVTDLQVAYGRYGAITDDTQMVMFTVEGLIRARIRDEQGLERVKTLYQAYLRWHDTQQRAKPPDRPHGYLAAVPELYARRAPGNTCLSALSSGRMGRTDFPINTQKGCGGVMRAAPAGLIGAKDPFRLGCEVAAITHSHPSGFLAAGALAQIIHELCRGQGLMDAVDLTLPRLKREPDHEEVAGALITAVDLARRGMATPENVETLGEGWVAEEALAMSIYCALCAEDWEQGLALAVTHSGDSDSTGAITGNLLGALWGAQRLPQRWLSRLELRDVLLELARDLHDAFAEPPSPALLLRYGP